MWLIVLNRKSGKGRASLLSQDLLSLLKKDGKDFKVIDENTAEQTRIQLSKEIANPKLETVVAIGGDGLVHLCIQLLANSDIGFAVIASGTGNDFARSMGFHRKKVFDIYNHISRSNSTKIDLGVVKSMVKQEWFVQVLSTGFDSNVNYLANKVRKPRGKIKYTIAMLLVLAKFRPIKYEVELDGNILMAESMFFSVANASNYGGGMMISPLASNTDGILNLIAVDPVSRFTLLRIFPRVFSGTHIKHPKVKSYTAKQISMKADTWAYADGEFISKLPVDISVDKSSLKTWHMA